ncbi:hypothetical protein CPC08DRAFT_731099 [Agrocybe pediades]|nr:hypothetical protein CPC08DRAFT_731099 [Agrocybe pediades]
MSKQRHLRWAGLYFHYCASSGTVCDGEKNPLDKKNIFIAIYVYDASLKLVVDIHKYIYSIAKKRGVIHVLVWMTPLSGSSSPLLAAHATRFPVPTFLRYCLDHPNPATSSSATLAPPVGFPAHPASSFTREPSLPRRLPLVVRPSPTLPRRCSPAFSYLPFDRGREHRRTPIWSSTGPLSALRKPFASVYAVVGSCCGGGVGVGVGVGVGFGGGGVGVGGGAQWWCTVVVHGAVRR